MLAVLALLLSAGAASADEASKTAKIEEMFQITNAKQMVQQVMEQMRSMQSAQLAKLEPAARARAEEDQNKMNQVLAERLSWDKLKPRLITLYSETFTEEELAGTLAFYKSPAGRALMEKMPVLMSRTMVMAQEMMAGTISDLQKK
jgi:hypothetical protein